MKNRRFHGLKTEKTINMFNNPDLHFPKTFRKTDGGSCFFFT